jgi:hypothetical protein
MRAAETRVQRARVEGTVKDTKTYYNRTIEHHSRYHAALERQFARTGLAGGYVWVSPFSGNGRKRGEPWLDEHRQGEMFRAAVRLLRIRPRPAKNTRHTYATVLLMAAARSPGRRAARALARRVREEVREVDPRRRRRRRARQGRGLHWTIGWPIGRKAAV